MRALGWYHQARQLPNRRLRSNTLVYSTLCDSWFRVPAALYILALAACSQTGPATNLTSASAPPESTAACARASEVAGWQPADALSGDASLSFEQLIATLATKRVVIVGEQHDRYDHHLNQLEILCRLHALDPNIALGLEFFQQPYQAALDDYVAGNTTVEQMLKHTRYFERWRFDYRLYAPILALARDLNVPVIALNASSEIVGRVAQDGFASLSAAERDQVTTLFDRGNQDYRERLKAIFEAHPGHEQRRFENFLDVQLLWDESMAERAAQYLEQAPERRLLVLAGAGHVAFGDGIPSRILARTDVTMATVLQSYQEVPSADSADFRLLSEPLELAPPGALGVRIDNSTDDGAAIIEITADGAADAAGMLAGDRIVQIDGVRVGDYVDLKTAMWQKTRGDAVHLRVLRETSPKELSFEFNLR